jgi:hypothetical protein
LDDLQQQIMSAVSNVQLSAMRNWQQTAGPADLQAGCFQGQLICGAEHAGWFEVLLHCAVTLCSAPCHIHSWCPPAELIAGQHIAQNTDQMQAIPHPPAKFCHTPTSICSGMQHGCQLHSSSASCICCCTADQRIRHTAVNAGVPAMHTFFDKLSATQARMRQQQTTQMFSTTINLSSVLCHF